MKIDLIMYAVTNFAFLIIGSYLIGQTYGWETGVGLGMLVHYLKPVEKIK